MVSVPTRRRANHAQTGKVGVAGPGRQGHAPRCHSACSGVGRPARRSSGHRWPVGSFRSITDVQVTSEDQHADWIFAVTRRLRPPHGRRGHPGSHTRQSHRLRPRQASAAGLPASPPHRGARPSRGRRPRSGDRRRMRACRPCARQVQPSCTHGMSLTCPNARIAASPGVRIGVPESTPNTPTLVIVIVPPCRSARRRLACPCGLGEPAERTGQRGQWQRVRVLDVRHDETAPGRRRDAKVHVALDHDLLLRRRPRKN